MSEETDLSVLGVEVRGRGVKETKSDLDQLTQSGGQAERQTGELTRATEVLAASMSQLVAALGANTSATNLNSAAARAHADSEKQVASATDAARAASDQLAATLLKEKRAQDEASKAAREDAEEKRKAAAATAELDNRLHTLRTAIDPVYGVQRKLNEQLKEAKSLYDAGAIEATEYGKACNVLNQRLAAVSGKHDEMAKSQGKATASSKALTQAGLNLSRQFADIGVTAAMGMNPLMILIQQGPQVADAFQMAASQGLGFRAVLGGIAAQAGPLVAVLAPWLALGAAVGGFAVLALQGQAETAKLNNLLAITGQQAKMTAADFDSMAKTIADDTNSSVGKARDVMSQFVATGKYTSETINYLTEDVIKLAQYTGKSTDEFVSMFNGMGSDVSAFAAKFNEQYKLITLSQYEHIRLLEEEGKTTEAQAYLAKAAHEGMAQVAVEQLGYVERGWRAVTNAVGDAIEAVKAFGREKTVDEKRDRVGHLNYLIGNMDNMPKTSQVGWMRDGWVKERDKLWSEVQTATKPSDRTGQAEAITASASVNALLDKVDRPGALERALNKFDENIQKLRKAGGEVPTDKQIAQIKDQIKKDFQPVSYQSPSQLASAAMRGLRQDDTTQDSIAKAEKDRLGAEMALTLDVAKIAQYKKDQVDFEAATAKANAEREVGLGKIKSAELSTITGKIDEAARLKKQKIDQDATAQAVRDELAARQSNSAYLDAISQYTAETATTQEERNKLERESLGRRQADEAYALAKNNEIKVSTGQISELSAAASQLELNRVQLMQGESVVRRQAIQAAREQVASTQAGLQSDIALLQSRQQFALSSYQSMQLERQISEKRYQIELASLNATTLENGFTADQVRTAKDSAETLKTIHENELKRLDLSKEFNVALADAIDATAGMAKSVIAGDFGGSISGLSKTLKSVGGLFKEGSGISNALGSAASFLGPVGTAVSAVSSVLGAIGEKSAAKAQAKLQEIDNSVKTLREANMSSSDSLKKSIDQAGRLFNSDLETSNEMLASLRSIDGQIGSLAVAVSRSIQTGKLFDTSTLGLGTTSKNGSILTGLANLVLGGKKTTTSLSDQGLNFGSQSYSSIESGGITGSTYADIISTTVKKFLGTAYSTKVKTSTVTGNIDGDLLDQISGVITALGSGVIKAAGVFGDEAAQAATKALENAQIDIGKLSFKDLKADEIEKLLNATFAKVGDDLAAAGVPAIEKFAKTGEGAFETLTRLARGYTVFDTSMKQIGKTFAETGVASLEARQRLIDLAGSIDDFASQATFFASNFLTEAEQLAPVQNTVTDGLTKLGLSAVTTKDQFKQVVQSIDVTTKGGAEMYSALMLLAPAFLKVANASETAAKAAEDEAEAKIATAKDMLKKAYDLELSGLQTQLSAVEQEIADTTQAIRDAFQAQREELQSTIEYLEDFTQSLKDYKKELTFGKSAGLSPEEQYNTTKALFEQTRALAEGGDKTAQGQFQSVSDAFLAASRDYNASGSAYFADLDKVKGATDRLLSSGEKALSDAEKQLKALNENEKAILGVKDEVKNLGELIKKLQTAEQAKKAIEDQIKALKDLVDPLLTVNESVLSVKDAVNNLSSVMQAAAAAADARAAASAAATLAAQQAIADAIAKSQQKPTETPTTTNPTTTTYTWDDYLKDNPDVGVGYSQVSQGYLKKLGINSVEDYAAWHFEHYGESEGRKGAGTYPSSAPIAPSSDISSAVQPTQQSVAPKVDNSEVVNALANVANLLSAQITQTGAVATKQSEDTQAVADKLDTVARRIAEQA